MAIRTLLPYLSLLLALLVGLAACGDDGPGRDAASDPLVALWLPVGPRRSDGSPPPGYLYLGANGQVEQSDGRRNIRGSWKAEGDKLVLPAADGQDEAPETEYRLDGDRLELIFASPRGERRVSFRRTTAPGPDAPAAFEDLAKRFAEHLAKRVGALAAERASKRGAGESVDFAEGESVIYGVTAQLVVPWTLKPKDGEAERGRFQFRFAWFDERWRLLSGGLLEDAHPDRRPPPIVQMGADGAPQLNDDSPFSSAVWQAWLDTSKD